MSDNFSVEPQGYDHGFAFDASVDERAEFLKKTYFHLFGAVILFIGILTTLMGLPNIEGIAGTMVSGYNWLIVLVAFMAVSYAAERMAQNATSLGMQYAGLALFVVFEAIIFVPLIYFATVMEAQLGVAIISPAAAATIGLFAALSLVVFCTRKDFSFLGGALKMAGFIAIAFIIASIFMGFSLGILFSVLMVGFASLWVLYDTSNVMHHYRTDQYVVASLALFASLALLFWYILRIAMYLANRD
jgi:FtsH-binding integral membrane protein